MASDFALENVTSWRHKFRTPKKERTKKTTSWLNATPLIFREESRMLSSCQYKNTPLALNYKMMRSVVNVLAFIEEIGCTSSICLFKVIDSRDTKIMKQINQVRNAIVDNTIAESFERLQNVGIDVVSTGLKYAILDYEPIIPLPLHQDLLQIEKTTSEHDIQKFLERLPEVNFLILMALLDFAFKKLKKQRAFKRQNKGVLNDFAGEIADLIVCNSTKMSLSARFQSHSVERSRRRAVKAILRSLLSESSEAIPPRNTAQTNSFGTNVSNFRKGDVGATEELNPASQLGKDESSNIDSLTEVTPFKKRNDWVASIDVASTIKKILEDEDANMLGAKLDICETPDEKSKHLFSVDMDELRELAIQKIIIDGSVNDSFVRRVSAAHLALTSYTKPY